MADENSTGPQSDPQTVAAFRERMAREHKPRLVMGPGGTVKEKLAIPTFDRSWHPNEIGEWLAEVEEDESVSEADIARARKAVAVALGVDDEEAGA